MRYVGDIYENVYESRKRAPLSSDQMTGEPQVGQIKTAEKEKINFYVGSTEALQDIERGMRGLCNEGDGVS